MPFIECMQLSWRAYVQLVMYVLTSVCMGKTMQLKNFLQFRFGCWAPNCPLYPLVAFKASHCNGSIWPTLNCWRSKGSLMIILYTHTIYTIYNIYINQFHKNNEMFGCGDSIRKKIHSHSSKQRRMWLIHTNSITIGLHQHFMYALPSWTWRSCCCTNQFRFRELHTFVVSIQFHLRRKTYTLSKKSLLNYDCE